MNLFTRHSRGFLLSCNAIVYGDVTIGEDASIWFNVVIRGDVAPIIIGRGTNVQDGVIIHCDSGVANEIGEDVTIGHGAIIHGKKIGNNTLIGMGATVLGETVIGNECLIAAGAVVPPGLVVPDRKVVMGVPGKIVRDVSEKDLKYMHWLPPHYVQLAKRHAAGEFRALV
jgi:carbonic anhydrase/acetyltransferase-like protein (isoleucine patch superfamily)